MSKRYLKNKFRGVYSGKTEADDLEDYKCRVLGDKNMDRVSSTKESEFDKSKKDSTLNFDTSGINVSRFKPIEKDKKNKEPYISKKQRTKDFFEKNAKSLTEVFFGLFLCLSGWVLYTTHDLDKEVAVQQKSIETFNKNLDDLQNKYNKLSSTDILEIREDLSYLKGLLSRQATIK